MALWLRSLLDGKVEWLVVVFNLVDGSIVHFGLGEYAIVSVVNFV